MVVPSWDPRWVKGLRYNFNKTNWCGYKCCIFNINLWIRENVWFVMDLYHITYEFTPTVCNELCKDVYMYFHREGEICLYLIGMYWWICTYIYIIYVLSNIPRLVSYKYIIIYIYIIYCAYICIRSVYGRFHSTAKTSVPWRFFFGFSSSSGVGRFLVCLRAAALQQFMNSRIKRIECEPLDATRWSICYANFRCLKKRK